MLSKLGKEPLCNGKPERAPHIGNFCFPLCWRCSFIVVGAFVGSLITFQISMPSPLQLLLGLLCCVPCLIDGLSQRFRDYVSTNPRRIITGFVAGIGFSFFALGLVNLLGHSGL